MANPYIPRAAAIAAISLFTSLGAQAQTVVTTNFQPNSGWQQVPNNSVQNVTSFVSGWSSANTLSLGDVGNAQFLWIDGGESATYTFSGLTIGHQYEVDLSYLFAGYRNGATNTQNALTISRSWDTNTRHVVENLTGGCAADAACAAIYASAQAPRNWNNQTFVATATDFSLTFAALGNAAQNSRIALDNVRVSVTAVPEPETYAMMLAGLGAVGFMARRRRNENRG